MKVWIVSFNEVIDYQENNYEPRVYSTYEKARKAFREIVDEILELLPEDWIREEGNNSFETYEEGYYDDNHSCVRISEVVVDEDE
jgi:hypothetical protein